jgi:hypothetical protein
MLTGDSVTSHRVGRGLGNKAMEEFRGSERDCLEDIDVDGRIILKCILKH